MNIPVKDLEGMLSIKQLEPQSDLASIENAAICALAATGPKSLSPELTSFFDHVTACGNGLAAELADNMEELQGIFLGTLHQSLQLAGLKLDSRLVLSLNREGKLVFEGPSPLREELAEVLASSTTLPALLGLLGVQHALLRTLGDLRVITEARQNAGGGKILEMQQAYRVCLKGSLSHFYSM